MRRDSAAPGLLVAFFAATLAMVAALVLLLRGGSDWFDFIAIALVLAVAAVVLMTIWGELGEDEPPGDDDPEAGR
jgi:membrane protein implicated in regulation of membrane protease activity